MEERLGWYINKGPLGMPRLVGEAAICMQQGGQWKAQFTNKNLLVQYVYGWRRCYEQELLMCLGIIDDFIYLIYCGKQYRRRIRDGKFQFHNLELVCHFTVDSKKE